MPTNRYMNITDTQPIAPDQRQYSYVPQVAIFDDKTVLALQTAVNAWLTEQALPLDESFILIRAIRYASGKDNTVLIHYDLYTPE